MSKVADKNFYEKVLESQKKASKVNNPEFLRGGCVCGGADMGDMVANQLGKIVSIEPPPLSGKGIEKKKRMSKKAIKEAAEEAARQEIEKMTKKGKKNMDIKKMEKKDEKVEIFNEPYDSWKDILAKVTLYLKKRGDKAGLKDVIGYIKRYDLYKKKEK